PSYSDASVRHLRATMWRTSEDLEGRSRGAGILPEASSACLAGCDMPYNDARSPHVASCANVPTYCLNEPEMSVWGTRSATVGGLQTADLLAALGQLGLDRDELCRAAGVDRQALNSLDSRIPTEQFVGILVEAERRRQDPLIGLHAGERCEPRGPVAYLLMSHGQLAGGQEWLARPAAPAMDRIRIALDVGLDTASLVIHPCDRTFELGFNRSSQHGFYVPSELNVGARRGPRRESASRASCVDACSTRARRRRGLRGRARAGRGPLG